MQQQYSVTQADAQILNITAVHPQPVAFLSTYEDYSFCSR